MAYYLGRDVSVALTTEATDYGLASVSGVLTTFDTDEGPANAVDLVIGGGREQPVFGTVPGTTRAYSNEISDLTGVDLSIGTIDEDITYMGQRSVLKAEIKKETTISLTKKKSDMLWDKVFNGTIKSGDELVSGTLNHGARWGTANNADGAIKISDGLLSPKDHNDGTSVTFGYRVFVQLSSGETISVPCMQITSHTVTLNADGTTEETMEFSSHVTPFIDADVTVTRISNA